MILGGSAPESKSDETEIFRRQHETMAVVRAAVSDAVASNGHRNSPSESQCGSEILRRLLELQGSTRLAPLAPFGESTCVQKKQD